jgi:hypothetical protein
MHAGSERWARRDRTVPALAQSSKKSCCRHNAAVQLQAVDLKARVSAPLQLHFKEAKRDDYLNIRACQLRRLVMPLGRDSDVRAIDPDPR